MCKFTVLYVREDCGKEKIVNSVFIKKTGQPLSKSYLSWMETLKPHLNLKSLALDDRPREKLIDKGRHALSDAELIAILLGSGSQNENVVLLAQRMLNENNNNLNDLARLNINDLKKYRGVGVAKAVSIAAALELGRRRKESAAVKRTKIQSSRDAYNAVSAHLIDQPHEEFWMLLLNRQNTVIRHEFISRGGVSGTVVDAKLIFKPALEHIASGIILAHNHPSGNLKPSNEDIGLTKKIKDAGKLLDINILDHLIIGEGSYYSFADEGII
jgi:DNA repair protein RadC